MAQVARISGQLLQDNLQRELADLKFDTDLLVVKRDNTLGINTTTTPRNLTINGTLRTASGNSDPDIIFNNSLKVGDFTIATTGISTGTGNVSLLSTHPEGFITTNGIGSYKFAVKGDGLQALGTNDSVGIKPEVYDGQTAVWNSLGNYGTYWYPGPINAVDSPDNDGTRLEAEANAIRLRGNPTAYELSVFDWDRDGDIQADDVLKTGTLNTSFGGGSAFPASRTLGDHPAPEVLKQHIIDYYPRSAPKILRLQTGSTLTVTGNIHATGNITYGGNSITIGDDSTDSASFLAEFKNNIEPDLDNVYHIGKDDDSTGPAKGFRINVNTLNADTVDASGIIYRGIELTKDVGLIFVSNGNGKDTNDGRNVGGPFASITKALSVAQDGDLIYIYPGSYQEEFPMTVPKGVTIQGDSIRGVEIQPTSATQSNDAFLLNVDTTIENLTVKDFFYNSGADTGYAFKFANNYNNVVFQQDPGRSPYIRNVSVITKGTTTSVTDPRGYDSADAGRGALVDGNVVASTSRSASMLFHSVTFITPGVTGLVLKSGVQVEWLNSFTYFAETSIKLEQGTGRTLPGGTTAYGAELRMIASASVYGNKGIVADGANCLAYAINHNFAYIGSGKNVTNDNTQTIQANEITETNNAKIYFTSQDQRGNFRVGDKFLVDLENERTSFDVESIFASNSRVQIRNGNDVVSLEPGLISLADIAIAGNNIETTVSNLEINSVGNINFTGNVVAPQVDISGNFTVGGSLTTLGDAPTDTVDFDTNISQDFEPGNNDGILKLYGDKSDPNFTYPKTYSLTANGITYTYNATGEDERNYFAGIGGLNVPGLTLGSHSLNGLTNAILITYTSQAVGDQLVLLGNASDATNGWVHLGHQPGTYKADGLDLGSSTLRWKNVYSTTANFDSVDISNQSIGTNVSNENLNLVAPDKIRFENLEFKDNKIISKFSPEGEFIVGDSTSEGYPGIFTGYLSLRSILPKYTTILGIPVLGTATVTDEAVQHAASLLGSYLDNNFDGVADDATLYAEFSDGLTAIIVYANASEESTLASSLGAFAVNRSFAVHQDEMNSYQLDGAGSNRNLVQEKIFKDLLVPKITTIYPDLSKTRVSTVTTAMDAARGGYQAGGQAGYNYPPFAWYTDATGLSYDNLVYEYLYLITAAVAGSLTWRSSTITSLFDHYNSLLLSNNDAAGYAIATNATYKLPITNQPSIDYWTSVTNNLGGTTRDIEFAPTHNLEISSTGTLSLPTGTSAQRPTISGALRYNTDYGTFEGVETAGSVSLGGIYDTDRDTYLDLSNNQFNFVTAGQTNHTLNGTLLESNGFSSGHKFSIDGNVVSNDISGGNSILRSNGTGKTIVDDGFFTFKDSNLHNTTNQNFKFTLTNATGNALLKFENVNGMVIPQGTTAQRPAGPEVGHTRYNLTLEYVETWNGSNWINAAGEVESIATSDVEELAYLFNLILD
jgi:hypothetical protein